MLSFIDFILSAYDNCVQVNSIYLDIWIQLFIQNPR